MSTVRWPRIKEILDTILVRWEEEHGREPKLKASHEGNLRWATKEELAQSTPYDKVLIEPDKVGNDRAEETNLVKILRRPIGAYRRMPSGGPYLSNDEIKEIAEWIDAGMPD